jgi:hypothetical protein
MMSYYPAMIAHELKSLHHLLPRTLRLSISPHPFCINSSQKNNYSVATKKAKKWNDDEDGSDTPLFGEPKQKRKRKLASRLVNAGDCIVAWLQSELHSLNRSPDQRPRKGLHLVDCPCRRVRAGRLCVEANAHELAKSPVTGTTGTAHVHQAKRTTH